MPSDATPPSMADSERRLRAEVLLLVSIAESHGLWSGVRVTAGGDLEERVVEGDAGAADEGHDQLEGALGAAVAAWVLAEGQAKWLRELANRFDQPGAPPGVSPERRAQLDRLLERLFREALGAANTPEESHAHVRFQSAIEAADSLGGLDAGERRNWDRQITILHRHAVDAGDLDDEGDDGPEPLLGLKAVLAGGQERNGKQVTSVECYDGGLVVRSRTSHEIPVSLRHAPDHEIFERFGERDLDLDPHLEVADDAGTEYYGGGGGGGSDVEEGLWISEWTFTFTPGVSPDASTLTVLLGGERFEFDVTGVAERANI